MQSLVSGILVLGTPTCLIATDQTIIAVNQPYLDITGRQAHEVIGNRIKDLVAAPGYVVARPYLEYALFEGHSCDGIIRLGD